MTFLSVRRLIPVCVVVVAALAAAIAPGSASAESDLTEQCSGKEIKGHGSTFQAPILVKWATEFNTSKNIKACSGGQGSGGKPTVEYLHEGANAGSGACLHGWGAESTEEVKFGEFGFCGTDEAPNPTQKAEIESHKSGGGEKSLETIPVLQGAVAVIVHLPKGCLAESKVEKAGKGYKLGRLVLDDTSIEGVYAGTIKTWKELLANQVAEDGAGSDKLTCKGGTAEEEKRITPVVRLDHSGTTHIFKSFLLQVNTEPKEMEAYPEEIGNKKTGCGAAKGEEEEKWSEVSEACQNQRWPAAAEVVRGTESGNPGVVKRVKEDESSIGYADLAVARELYFFSGKCSVRTECGGENTQGEQKAKFWAEVQDSETPEASGFYDPSSDGDVEAAANSACGSTVYTNEAGKKFPPANTREPWNGAKAELVEEKYSICGLTYDLALRQYKYYPGTSKEEAQTVHDFLLWAVNPKEEGGGPLAEHTDYSKLASSIITKSQEGLKEIGFEKA